MKRCISIILLLLFIVYQAVIINDQKNDIIIQKWAIEEVGRDFAIQRGMLQRCEKIVMGQ